MKTNETDFQDFAKLGDFLGPQSEKKSAMRILLVEDNPDHRELMRLALTRHNLTWQVEGVVSGEEVLRRLREGEAYDIAFLDYSLPGRDGLEVLEEIRRGEVPPPVVMVTGRGDEQVAVEAIKGGAYDYVVKAEGYLQRLPVVAQRAVEAHQLTLKRKRAEEALRRKSGEQALLLDNIQTQVWYLSDKETYGAVNKARAKFFGKKNGEMENKKVYDVLGKGEADICMSGYVEVFEKKKQVHTEEWIMNAKGEKRLLSIINTTASF